MEDQGFSTDRRSYLNLLKNAYLILCVKSWQMEFETVVKNLDEVKLSV